MAEQTTAAVIVIGILCMPQLMAILLLINMRRAVEKMIDRPRLLNREMRIGNAEERRQINVQVPTFV